MNEHSRICDLLSDPLIAPIASDAIKNMDLSKEAFYGKTLAELREEHFGGNLIRGFQRLFRAARTGAWYYPVYSEEECRQDPDKAGVSLVWFPSDDPTADEKPYVLVVPGGGFVNVWNLSEGWPIADHFNCKGYHAFILTYTVGGENRVIPGEMDDFAKAIGFIRDHADLFPVKWDRYITCGFSAGGYLISLWSTLKHGYAAYGLPEPAAMFPVYPFISWNLARHDDDFDPDSMAMLGCAVSEAEANGFEIPVETEAFPPAAIFLAAQDTLVPPMHSRLLKEALDRNGIPCRLEIGPEGGHGFADGSGMCMEGWPERAIDWFESL